MASTVKPIYGSATALTITNLNSLANSATAGWQSARVTNLSTRATDYEIGIKLDMANTAAGSDKAIYIFVVPWFTSDAGTTWYANDQGTTTLPTGSEGTTTIGATHNLRQLGVLNYVATDQVVQGTFLLSNAIGNMPPHGFSLIIINFSGAAIAASGNIVQYTPLNIELV